MIKIRKLKHMIPLLHVLLKKNVQINMMKKQKMIMEKTTLC